MRRLTTIAVILCACAAFGQSQTTTPGSLTVVFDQVNPPTPPPPPSGCAEQLLSCVSQVNGVPVCPYGRVAWYPLPGQPYTAINYPKVDQKGQPINLFKCVWNLPPNLPWTIPGWDTAAHD